MFETQSLKPVCYFDVIHRTWNTFICELKYYQMSHMHKFKLEISSRQSDFASRNKGEIVYLKRKSKTEPSSEHVQEKIFSCIEFSPCIAPPV